jgi:putative ABC transport system permease protein
VLITILAMINATTAAIIDRAPDLSTWRAVGLERARLVRLLALEASVLGLLAGVLGAIAGAALGWTLVRVVAPAIAGFRLETVWPTGWAPAIIVATTVFAGATAWAVGKSRMPRRVEVRERGWR